MKIFIPFLLILASFSSIAQSNYAEVDRFVKAGDFDNSSVATLTKELTENFDRDEDKLRAIFTWITDNIAYDCKKYHSGKIQSGLKIEAATKEEVQAQIAEYRADEMSHTLKKKKGVCQDYSYLFKAMCEEISVEAEFIPGHTRNGRNSIGRIPRTFTHAWNSVKLNDEWFFVDATWGSGSADPDCTKFRKREKDAYFLVKPSDLIKSHLPKEEHFQHLDKPMSNEEFSVQPYVGYGYHSLQVQDYFPKKGIIDLNGKTKIKIKTGEGIPAPDFLLFSGTKNIKIATKQEGDFTVIEFDHKQVRGRTLAVAIRISSIELDEVISYKLK